MKKLFLVFTLILSLFLTNPTYANNGEKEPYKGAFVRNNTVTFLTERELKEFKYKMSRGKNYKSLVPSSNNFSMDKLNSNEYKLKN